MSSKKSRGRNENIDATSPTWVSSTSVSPHDSADGRLRNLSGPSYVGELVRNSLLAALVIPMLVLAGCGEPSGDADHEATQRSAPEATSDAPAGSKGAELQPPVDGPVPDTRTGAVELDSRSGCIKEYDADAVASRGFAFDGTVVGIDDAGVTFEVHEWFVGDQPATVTVRMGGPTQPGMSESAPSYSVGTRLLVSGEEDTAWACGFTRYYDEQTAATWRS